MVEFKNFVNEAKSDEHEHGTYVSVKLDKKSVKELDTWATNTGIKNLIDPTEYHATVIYSRKPVPNAAEYDLKLPLDAKISNWKIFDTQQNTKALVGAIKSPALEKAHKDLKAMGASHGFPDYQPHVTLSYNYGSDEVPEKLPDIKLVFSEKAVKPLDPTWSSKKK